MSRGEKGDLWDTPLPLTRSQVLFNIGEVGKTPPTRGGTRGGTGHAHAEPPTPFHSVLTCRA